MKTIAFDTSNQPLSVALFEDDNLIDQRETNVRRNHSTQLLPFIDELVKQANWTPQDLDNVIVSQGPGSYTGLRIAVTTAKTLAFTLNISLTDISSLALLAANVADTNAVIVPIMDARNQNIYAAQYQWESGRLVVRQPDKHMNIDKLHAALETMQQPIIFVGEWQRFEDQLRELFPAATFAQDNLPHAANMMSLAQDSAKLTDMNDIHQFVPNYHRLSQAEADWAKAHPEDQGGHAYVEKV
ncbi:tRNA (adenosine(37)-N6)-threonylcarbamoyltransferase complex dimerization subunit type 1 TsaB [Weissella thailandensis]|uniref:tRNA (Adenosine(37)-N6)-threonylcarbamoyltransferase complex dimerization subunit type 1 TsaB n=1 Tax=Weissella thailandensis TaxID=89061 RepID=A0ABX9I486_9LACO|nr:tRNA (adenosine(37)-N6)-threonylcarbamoyltransferase complex dimerization subunit type 1 TsaB [Weissella thailandensis]NKY90989.1 tRNA (adenosine(37)-N6)-threonylcarbamoyltransferase complex dimerization subunit type 1 TsaB [Weissella thailandensis]RDS59493.1 tRNA (adenosine(37)-N6)-threonylcarbamoyltransferase complex dimerization subunit type 1 TsaB [Weissella thailandensis]GEP74415.1 tRNA (adenosine(37)-N6)-threonylcarbamoyltransferase complex dimerization subunit type 1 TsaB [Weissella th